MSKLAILSVAGVTILLALLLACSTVGLGVRQGVLPDVLVRFPPNTPFQFILRIGSDTLPWSSGSGRQTAITLWAHQNGTSWHIVRIVYVPLGERE